MGRIVALLILLLIPVDRVDARAVDATGDGERQAETGFGADPAIVFGPSPPPPDEVRRRLLDWRQRCERQLDPVTLRWRQLLEALHRFHLLQLEERCERFEDAVERLEGGELVPAPDRVVDLHLRRLLDQLRASARVCSRRHYFETGHRLELAAEALGEMRRAVDRSLGSQATSSTDPVSTLEAAARGEGSAEVGDLFGGTEK